MAIYDTHYDYLPAFHQILVSIQLLYLKSDILVVPMSFLSAVGVSLAVYAFARSLGWGGYLPLAASVVLWTTPAFVLHASAANFDILTGLWLVLSLYFLRRGYAATDPRWLLPAALAVGLGLGTKLTFAFAAPALALAWGAVLLRALLRGRRTRAIQAVVLSALAVTVVGLPFLIRNVVLQGYLLGPPQLQAFLSGDLTPLERVRLLGFNTLALGFQLVTPPFLLPEAIALRLNTSFVYHVGSLGFALPDPTLTPAVDLMSIDRHALPGHRYDSNHASFGGAFVLVLMPSMLAVGLARRRLGARWPFAVLCVVVWGAYFVTYGLVYLYQTASIRFLIEPMTVAAVVAPAWLVFLPRRVVPVVLVLLAIPLVAEANDAIMNSRWSAPARVIQTSRTDQQALFDGSPPNDAPRMLDRKYPAWLVPEIYIDDPGTGHPGFPDYLFLGPSLQRRTHYWVGRSGSIPPGPLLVNDPSVAQILLEAGMLPDRLTTEYWVFLPNDRLRVRVLVVQDRPDQGPVLRLTASVPPGRYQRPTFDLVQRIRTTTTTVTATFRDYAAEPTFDLPLTYGNRVGTLVISVRDGDAGPPSETVELDSAFLLGL